MCQGLGRGAGHRDPARTEGLAVGTAAWAGGKPETPGHGPGGTSLLAEGSPSPPPGWPQGPQRGRGRGCPAIPNPQTMELCPPHQEPAQFLQLLEPKPERQLLSSNSQSKESMKVKVAGTIRSMEFSRQEHWSGSPFPSPGVLPNPEIEPGSPAFQADSLLSESPGKPYVYH